MSDTPVIFKRTKLKPSQRTRPAPSDSHDEPLPSSSEVTAAEEESLDKIATRIKKQGKARSKAKLTLSFGGEDEEGQGEIFPVKKSNLSRKLALGRASALAGSVLPSPHDPISASPQSNKEGPTYDANYLSELKASTPSARPSQPVTRTYDISYDADTSIVNDFENVDISLDNSFETTEMEIPTSSYIFAAKKKRDVLRKTGETGEDFISLSVTKRLDQDMGPHPESRLMREEDELGEADDEFAEYTSAQERIALGKKSRKLEATKKREQMQVAIEETHEDEEEEMEWEQEQLRRGGHRAHSHDSQVPVKAVYKPAPIPPITPIPTLDPAVARLTQALTTLTTSHAQNTSSMSSLAEEQIQLEAKEKELRQIIERTESKRSWFVAFREWVEAVASFLDEKFPLLEKLEAEHVSLLKEKSDIISDRRKQDDEDDLSLCFGDVSQLPSEQPLASTRKDRFTARIHRRLQRRRANPPREIQEEGYSTDSSLPPPESQDFQTALVKLHDKAGQVLDDVQAEEFKDPRIGLNKWFGKWREQYEDIYVGAWGGLALIGAWEFWARLEIVGWNPFQDKRNFDSFDWYEGLFEYSRPLQPNNEELHGDAELGPEGDLVSAMISTAIVPRLCTLVEGGGFDPYSIRDVRTITDLAEQVEIAVRDTANLKFQMLLKSVFAAFQKAVDAEKALLAPYLNANRPRFDPEAIPARKRYLYRRIKLIEGIIRWRKYSGETLGIGRLIMQLVDEVLVPVAEGGWEVGGQTCLRKLEQVLPKDLMTPELATRLGNVEAGFK